MNIRPYHPRDETAVLDLWTASGLVTAQTRSVARDDLQRKLQVQPELFIVGTLGGQVIATAMAGYDGHRGHVYYVAVHPDHRRRGHARGILAAVQSLLRERGCHRLTLFVSCDNLEVEGFYRRLGFERNDVVSMGLDL